MSTRYIATLSELPADGGVHSTPDYALNGWQFAAYSDLNPGPVGIVAVAVTEESGREQCDVTLLLDHACGVGLRTRSAYKWADWGGDNDKEEPEVIYDSADTQAIDSLRISAYGAWGRQGLASALREAAAMLEAVDGRTGPEVS